jgi:protein TonB
MIIRYAIATVVAVGVAFGLFFLMQSLIAMSGLGDDKVYSGRVIDFVRLKRAETTLAKKRELPQKHAMQNNPKPPPMTMPKGSADGGMDAIAVAAPRVDAKIDIAGGPSLGGAPSDADVIPLVRVNPQYPRTAAQRKIEGWVQVEFTISVTGSVKNAKVVAAEPRGVFDRAAIRAIRKWKYKPKIEEGKAVERYNVRVQLTFELEDEG